MHFFKKWKLFSKTKIVRNIALFQVVANLFNAWLNRRQLDHCISFCLNLLQYVFIDVHEENLASGRYLIRKGRTGQARWRVPVIPATQEAEAELPEPRRRRNSEPRSRHCTPAWVTRVTLRLKKKKYTLFHHNWKK